MIPPSSAEVLARSQKYREEIEASKKGANLAWYPFDSLSAVPLITELIEPHFPQIWQSIQRKSVLDLGCGDSDLACLFSKLGADVDAVDSATTNFNRMAGVKTLCNAILTRFEFPREQYGLTLFLGALYHLKNPYYLLEKLAFKTEWCVLSTRITQLTPRVGAAIEQEPVAYLADGREINNDATNYWIFSAAGLFRIVQRTR